jgi:hypothetical protein
LFRPFPPVARLEAGCQEAFARSLTSRFFSRRHRLI